MLRTIRLLLALTVVLAHPGLAEACEPYSVDDFRSEITAVDALLDSVSLDDAGVQLAAIAERLPCLVDAAPPSDMARFSLQRATVAFFGQDELLALRWARAALFSDSAAPWPALVAEGHPVRTLSEDNGAPLWGAPDGGFSVDRRGAVLASGIFLSTPRLPSEVPLLIQVFDRRGDWVEAHWQDGPAFPEAMIDAGEDPMDAPDWVVVTAPGLAESDQAFAPSVQDPDDPMLVEDDLPPEPVVPVDTRPVEERAREAWEQAVWIADANPSIGRGKIQDFLDEFGESGIPEVGDANRWMAAHPEEEVAVADADEPEPEPERRTRRERRQRTPRTRTPKERRRRAERRSQPEDVVEAESPVQVEAESPVQVETTPEAETPVVDHAPVPESDPEVDAASQVTFAPAEALVEAVVEPPEAEAVAMTPDMPVEADAAAVSLTTLRSATPQVRMTSTRDVVIDLAGVSGDTVCLSESTTCRKPKPLRDAVAFRMSGRSGLHAVHVTVDGSEGRSTHTAWFWLDTRAPKLGSLTVVPDAAGWTALATDLADADSRVDSWIVGQASGRGKDDCSHVIVESDSPAVWVSREQAQWNSLVFCAVDAAGNRSKPTTIKLDFDAEASLIPWGEEPVAWYPIPTVLPALHDSGTVCRNDKPTCRRFRSVAEVPPHRLDASRALQSAYTFTEVGSEVSSAVRHVVVENSPPVDGGLTSLASDDVLIVGWPGARDRETDIVSYRLVGDTTNRPSDCVSSPTLYEGPALWTTLPRGDWQLRVCAIDRAGNMSDGATARVRD